MTPSCFLPHAVFSLILLGAPVLAAGADARATPPNGTAATLESVQKTAAEWTRLQAETARLEADWKRERALLESTTAALTERMNALQARRDAVEARSATARAEIDALRSRHGELVRSMASTEERVQRLVDGLIELRPWLPPRLSLSLELPYRTIADRSRSAGERMQYVTGILGRCLQFNKSITYSEEVLPAATGGGERVFEVMYWGMAEAYAYDRVTGHAFLGRSGADGWSWTAGDAAAERIRALIDVYKDKLEPQFVELPAQLSALPDEGGAK